MSSTQKTISINPALFQMSGNKKTRKEKDNKVKQRENSLMKPSTLKNKFIQKVKQHQQKKKEGGKKTKENEFKSEFEESIKYLSSLIEKDKSENETKQEIRNEKNLDKLDTFQQDNFLREQVNVELPNDLKKPETIFNRKSLKPLMDENKVPYGCLRNGSKPTYRQWMQTRKRPFKQEKININEPIFVNNDENIKRQEKLKAVKSMFQGEKEIKQEPLQINVNEIEKNKLLEDPITIIDSNNSISVNNVTPIIAKNPKIAIKKKITRKYICGKNPKTRKIGILIKDGEGRAKIIREKRNLSRRNINDVKKYLHNNGLLKVGTHAPKKILMDMYEACILTGKILNVNDKIHIHNFLNSNGS
jgi:hypothetical protein